MMRLFTLLGAPSLPLLALLADLIARRRLFAANERRALLAALAAIAILLYGSTLGYLPPDLYRLGFSPWAPIALAVVAIAIAKRAPAIAITALVALGAYDIPLYRSVNLFDYVVDPIVGLIAIVFAIATAVRVALADRV